MASLRVLSGVFSSKTDSRSSSPTAPRRTSPSKDRRPFTSGSAGRAHFHPQLRLYVNGKQAKVPANIGIDPGKPSMDMASLHTHDTSGTIHVEGMERAKLGQFFVVWGVPFSKDRLGPYRATKRKRVKMWVDDKPSRAFATWSFTTGSR